MVGSAKRPLKHELHSHELFRKRRSQAGHADHPATISDRTHDLTQRSNLYSDEKIGHGASGWRECVTIDDHVSQRLCGCKIAFILDTGLARVAIVLVRVGERHLFL